MVDETSRNGLQSTDSWKTQIFKKQEKKHFKRRLRHKKKARWKTVWLFPMMLNIELLYDPAILFLMVY